MDQLQSISEVLRLLRRRATVWAPIAFIGIVASIFYAIGLPREYETTAVIQIGTTDIQIG